MHCVLRIMFFVRDSVIAKILGAGVEMVMDDDATVLDVIAKADEMMKKKGGFPLKEYKSLLHMVYNPEADRFYSQVGVHAYVKPGEFYNIKDNVRQELLNGMIITIIPSAGCITAFEEPLNYEEFTKALEDYGRVS